MQLGYARIIPEDGQEALELPMPTRVQMNGTRGAFLVWYQEPTVRPRALHLMALSANQTQTRTGFDVGVDRKVPLCRVTWSVYDFSGSMTGVLVQGAMDRNMFTLELLKADNVFVLATDT